MPPPDTLLLNVARNLRYRTLVPMIGELVTVGDRMRIAAETAAFVARFADGCSLSGPAQNFLDGQIAKYGLLDLLFTAPAEMLDADCEVGVPLLRDLGFVKGDEQDLTDEHGGDSVYCLEQLRAGIAENKTYLMLFLQSSNPRVAEMSMAERMARIRDPTRIRFPVEFTVEDACVSNSPFVWMNKHFYM